MTQTPGEYRNLREEQILGTIRALSNRIEERFPKRGLSGVCREFYAVAQETLERVAGLRRPNLYLRVAIFLLIAILAWAAISGMLNLSITVESFGLVDLFQLLDSAIQDLVFAGAGVFFLVSIEARIKRQRALEGINELRVLAHVIDMHQLTKDPEMTLRPGKRTKSSPMREMNTFELTRYLDYCSEMLSLIGKVSALYAQDFHDPVVLAAVNEMENLTNGLARKVWQKIMIIDQMQGKQKA